MTRVVLILLTLFLLSFLGCSDSPAPTQNVSVPTVPAAAPSASPSVMAVAPTLAMPLPAPSTAGASGANKPEPNEQKKLPSVIEDRLKRALTLEEINQLPPEIRDTILRAQGRLPASPAPAPKKK